MELIDVPRARRLALARAGLLQPERTGLVRRATGRGARARAAAHGIIERFGYLQLDSVSVAGARSHAIVLLSRLAGFDPGLAEELLEPGAPLFEYWGHEVSWIPLRLYPVLEFRRREFSAHPWWGDLVGEHPEVAQALLRRIEQEGPLRSLDLESSSGGWWNLKTSKKVLLALWSAGDLAVVRRQRFQRTFDLAERVIPEQYRRQGLAKQEALLVLLERALDGHGWASLGTLLATWRLKGEQAAAAQALRQLQAEGVVTPCALVNHGGRKTQGWIKVRDLELAERLAAARPRRDRGILLSPFDPVLWDRARVRQLFGFEQMLEIFKPADKRRYGYYCLPVLAGDRLVARVDLKAQRAHAALDVLSWHPEADGAGVPLQRRAAETAVSRYAEALGLEPRWPAAP